MRDTGDTFDQGPSIEFIDEQYIDVSHFNRGLQPEFMTAELSVWTPLSRRWSCWTLRSNAYARRLW